MCVQNLVHNIPRLVHLFSYQLKTVWPQMLRLQQQHMGDSTVTGLHQGINMWILLGTSHLLQLKRNRFTVWENKAVKIGQLRTKHKTLPNYGQQVRHPKKTRLAKNSEKSKFWQNIKSFFFYVPQYTKTSCWSTIFRMGTIGTTTCSIFSGYDWVLLYC